MPPDIPPTSHIPQMKVVAQTAAVLILESHTLVSIIQKTVLKILQFVSEYNKCGLLH
jgi:hypothetical protein